MTEEFLRDAFSVCFDLRQECNKDWRVPSLVVKDFVVDFWIKQLFLRKNWGNVLTPSFIVDNFLVNDEWGDRENWNLTKNKAKKLYKEGKIAFYDSKTDTVIISLRDYSRVDNGIIVGGMI